jgi:hypothetical protein
MVAKYPLKLRGGERQLSLLFTKHGTEIPFATSGIVGNSELSSDLI